MKRISLLLIKLFIFFILLKAQNPFEDLGVKCEMLTLSKGKFCEFFPNDTIVRIGSVIFNTITNQVVDLVVIDSTNENDLRIQPYITSRWMSPDPLTEKYMEWSPYNFCYNNPVRFIDLNGMEGTDWYKAADGQLLWKEGTEKSVTLASNVDNEGNVLATKTYDWIASDGAKLGADGANVVMTTGGTDKFNRDVINTANASTENTVIGIAGSDGAVGVMENVTKSFGQVNNVTMRDHGNGESVFGLLSKNDFSSLKNSISSGNIKLNANSNFYFLGCNNASFAKSFTTEFGYSSFGASGGVGPQNSKGEYNSGDRAYSNQFYNYRMQISGIYPVSYKPSFVSLPSLRGYDIRKALNEKAMGKIIDVTK